MRDEHAGEGGSERRVGVVIGLVGASVALAQCAFMRGFTVDDALIPIRYAHHVALGQGYRFNLASPPSDGVTPLPWAFLLAPFSRGDAMTALGWAKAIGAFAWTIAAFALARATWRLAGPRRIDIGLAALGWVVLALAFPIGAWAASGLETGLVTCLATFAAIGAVETRARSGRRFALVAGLAATLRPELVVWAVALAVASSLRREDARGGQAATLRVEPARVAIAALRGGGLALAPFVVCAVVRMIAFGSPAPLSVSAKPSDVEHGLVYAVAASIVVLTPLLALAPLASLRSRTWPLTVAFAAHLGAVVVVGGDWMPYARLMVPVAPSLVLVYAASAQHAAKSLHVLRAGSALMLGVYFVVRAAPAGRHVEEDRRALIALARPALRDAHVVAALDIGWVSASTDARIVDLAGLTDPEIAALAGGHTSKHVSTAMLLERGVDTVLIYSDVRAVEARIVRSPLFATRFVHVVDLPLGTASASYAVYRRRP